MSKGIFVTATGTDVGKTYVTGLLVKKMRELGHNAGYYKAALSGAELVGGCLIPGDAAHVKTVSQLDTSLEDMVSYVYETAVSPHLAAKLEGNPPDPVKIAEDYGSLQQRYSYLAVEGSGGIVCPLCMDQRQYMLTDLIKQLKLSVIIIASAGLGTINGTVLTAAYARQQGIDIKGIMLNRFHTGDIMEEDNRQRIEQLTGVPVVASIKDNDTDLQIEEETLLKLFE